MTLIHVVLFEFKADSDEAAVDKLCKMFLDLPQKCIHPTSNKPFIKSMTGGRNNSIEELSFGLKYGFTIEFENAEDRDYYVKEDPAHKAFVAEVTPHIQGVRIFDYTPGVF